MRGKSRHLTAQPKVDQKRRVVQSAVGKHRRASMPNITDGTTIFQLEVGQSYAGWTLVEIEHNQGHAIGTHLFTFRRGNEVRRITNLQWPGERALCSNGGFGVFLCPPELALFSYRTTKVVEDSRRAARTGD